MQEEINNYLLKKQNTFKRKFFETFIKKSGVQRRKLATRPISKESFFMNSGEQQLETWCELVFLNVLQ